MTNYRVEVWYDSYGYDWTQSKWMTLRAAQAYARARLNDSEQKAYRAVIRRANPGQALLVHVETVTAGGAR